VDGCSSPHSELLQQASSTWVKEGADQVIRKNSTMPPWNAVVKTFERYKFAITFENRQLKG